MDAMTKKKEKKWIKRKITKGHFVRHVDYLTCLHCKHVNK